MVDAIHDWHGPQVKRIDTLETCHVEAILPGLRAPLVMRVDAAHRAEIVLRRSCVELVKRELVRSLQDSQAVNGNRGGYRTSHAAKRTIATTDFLESLWEIQFELHCAAMAGGGVNGVDLHLLTLG